MGKEILRNGGGNHGEAVTGLSTGFRALSGCRGLSGRRGYQDAGLRAKGYAGGYQGEGAIRMQGEGEGRIRMQGRRAKGEGLRAKG